MGYYIKPDGSYYEGDQADLHDQPVPQRPSHYFSWQNGTWVATANPPDIIGFQNAIKSSLGGIVGANALAVAYPLFMETLQQYVWADLQALIIDAQSKGVLNPTQYGAIKNAASAYSIPITLP